MKLIMLGAPGAGKGTQAKRIAAKYGIPHISTGDIFRANIKNGTELGKKAQTYMDQGLLVPDELVCDLVVDRIQQSDCEKGYVLDGFPRTIPQAEALDKMGIKLDHVVSLEVSDDEIVKRMSGRRVCTKCGTSYHITGNPSKDGENCDKCNLSLTIRKDDAPEVVLKRLAVYHSTTEPLKDFYAKKGNLKIVYGADSVEETTALTLAALGV